MLPRNPLLLTPGPTPVPPEVLRALARPLFHHRTAAYQKLFREVSEGLQGVFKTRHPVYTFAASGTGAMEAAIANFHSPGDCVLVVEGGKFGERFWRIARAYGLEVQILKVKYGEAPEPDGIIEALRKHPETRSVCLQLCETSTGVVCDIKTIARLLGGGNRPLLVVDAISGLAADRFEMDAWGVDLAISGSQKGLMLPPGLAFLAVGPRAKERMKTARLPRFYFDLSLYEKAMAQGDTPFTPAISHVVALRAVLGRIEKIGLESLLKRTASLARYTRQKLEQLGFELFAKRPSNALAAVRVPRGVDAKSLLKRIQEKEGITIAGGQAELEGEIIRIAHMGFITKKDIDRGLRALKKHLKKARGEK